MALVKCPECDRNISDQAGVCPGCGYAFKKKDKPEIPIWAQTIALLLIPIGTTIIGGLFAWSQTGRENDSKLIEIATGVLSAAPKDNPSDAEMRQWARSTINRYAQDDLPPLTDSVQLPSSANTAADALEVANLLEPVLNVLNADSIRLVSAPDFPMVSGAQDTPDGPIILYNAADARRMQQQSGSGWFTTFMLAHETGHVVLGHTKLSSITPQQQYRFELEADSVAGVVLRRLGAPLVEIQQIFSSWPRVEPDSASPFPDVPAHLKAVEAGWRTAVVRAN
jgi:hypothetical protein